jgi:septal ring factor EnvC (AmiA/AmiB activator)
MAGIFANVDSDIQKLQKLKQEIENVKKSLKSINVKVDIDIAQGLEAQLKSLTTQYDALAAKVGETEARITASANKIIDASNKIIQAQDKMSQAAKGINTSSSTNTNSSTNASETTSIQAQAKAYEELKAEIGDVLGTRGQNIKRLIEEQNAVRLLNAEIKKITKSQGESSSLSSAQQRRLEQLNNSLLTHKTALAEVRQSLSANAKLDNAAATSMDALSQSLGRMRAAYRALTESERTSPFGKELLVSIQQADAKIKELDATIGNHQRNVGNYASGWNGLSMSIQQIGRELPSLAAGWRTFFLAISNNLPILADEIKRARIQFEALKKSGQTAIPVWKQVVSSIVSWQTALTVGITLLTLYGDKLVKWISGLGKAEKAIKNLYTAQRDLYNVTSTGMEQSSKEITKLNSLYKIATDVTKSTKERNNAVKELKRSFPSHLKNLSDESIKNGEVAKSIKEQTRQIIANAKATAAADQIAKNWYKSFQAGVSKNIAYITKQRLEQELVAKEATVQQLSQMRARPESYAGLAKEIEGIKDRIKETDREIAIQENLQDSYQKSSQSLEKLVTVAGLGGKYENPDKNYNSILDQQKKIANLLDKQALERKRREEDLENQVVQSRIDAMAEGEAKIRAQRELDNKKEIQDLKRQREDYIRTEIEYQRKLFDAREELNVKKNKNYKKKTFDPSSVKVDTSSIDATIGYVSKRQINDQIRNQEEAWNEYIIKYGTFQQKKEAITRKYADAINKAANAGEAASLQKEFEEALANLDLSKLKEEINWEMIFGDLSKVTKDQLTKIKKQLQEFKKSSEFKNATPEQIQVIETAINSINDTLVDKGGFFGGMADSMKELADATEQLKKAEEELVEANKKGTDAEKEEAQKKVNKAQNTQVNAQTNVEKSRDKAISNITAVADAMQQLGSAEFNLSSFGSAVGGLVDALSESGSKIGGIIAAVLSLLDEFGKDGGVEFGKNIVNNVISAIGGTIEVPFKMLGIDLGLGGANYSDYNEMVAKYDVLLDVWD